MPALFTILDHIFFLILGRAVYGMNPRNGSLRYADWFIASCSLYFASWGALGFINYAFRDFPCDSRTHLALGIIILLPLILRRFPSRDFGQILLPEFRGFFCATQESLRKVKSKIWVIRYMAFLLVAGYSYFIYKGTSVPLNEFDVLSYHMPMAMDFFRTHSLIPEPDRYWHFYFPANFETWLSTWLFVGRSKLLAIPQLFCIIPISLMQYMLTRQLGGTRILAWTSALAILGTPILLFQSVTPMNEMFSLPFLIGIFLYTLRYLNTQQRLDAILAGCSLGLAIGTKYSFLVLILAIPIALLAALYVKEGVNRKSTRSWMSFVLYFISPALILPSFWYLKNLWLKGNPFFPFQLNIFGRVIFPGISTVFDPAFEYNFVLHKWHWLIYLLGENHYSASQGFGYLAGGIGIVAFVAAIMIDLRNARRRILSIFYLIISVLSILFWWYATQHEPRFLIFFLPILVIIVSKLFQQKMFIRNLNAFLLLVIFALTIGRAMLFMQNDIKGFKYDGNFLAFYCLAEQIDDWGPEETLLLFYEGDYGHLLTYALSGSELKRRVIVVGLSKIKSNEALKSLLKNNEELLQPEIQRIIYITNASQADLDITKIMNLYSYERNRTPKRNSSFVLDRSYLIIEYHAIGNQITLKDNSTF